MSVPQGTMEFAGISEIISGTFTLGHGLSPSIASLYVPPIARTLPAVGPLTLRYGGGRITFPDCKLDKVTRDYTEEGREVWGLHILDHRWRWKYGRVSGRYNQRDSEQNLIAATKKDLRELAKICFDALSEKKIDLTGLPKDQLPEIEWDYSRPDQALGPLLDAAGCRVVLTPGNRIVIAKKGFGNRLPTGSVVSASLEADPAERPDELIFAGRTLWQADIPLEAIGREVSGEWKPIDKLSYKPKEGWERVDAPHFTSITDPKVRMLAQEYVYRTYQIKAPFTVEGYGEIKDIERVLPLETQQIKKSKFENRQRPQSLPPWVYGLYYPNGATVTNNFEAMKKLEPIAGNIKKYPQGLYTLGFSVDAAKGIVTFSDHVVRRDTENGLKLPADLRLRIAIGIRDPDTGGWIRTEVKRKLPGDKLGTMPEYLVRDDVALSFYKDDGEAKITTNRTDFEKQAKYYLDAREKELEYNDPATYEFAGFVDVYPDGAIQQVTWSVNEAGFATTRASRNREEPGRAMSYTERRWHERVQAMLQKETREQTKGGRRS